MQLCELCDRPVPSDGWCACLARALPCAAVSAFGSARYRDQATEDLSPVTRPARRTTVPPRPHRCSRPDRTRVPA